MMRQARIVVALVAAVLLVSSCTTIKKTLYEGFNRDEWQQPDRVVEALAIQPGDRIADLGAGSGYFTFRLANATGESGKVYATDVDEAMLDALKKDIATSEVKNVETLLGKETDPKLPQGSVDLIFLCNVYHHLENQAEYFKNLKKYLRPKGRIAIIDYQSGMHSTPAETIRNQLVEAGYHRQAQYDFLEKQNFQIFMPNP